MLLLLALLAAATPSLDEGDPPPDAHATASSDALVHLARIRADEGDHEGARILLDQARERPGADLDAILYLEGIAWEFGGDPATAIARYEEGLERWPEGPNTKHRRFRKAEALGTLGSPREALRALRRIRVSRLDDFDRRKYRLVEGVFLVDLGRSRRGLRRLHRWLERVPEDELTFYQGKARAAIAREWSREAAALDLEVGERRQVRRLEARARLLAAIEALVTEIAHLEEPEWVLEGLLVLGDAYDRIGIDLRAHPRPPSLTSAQLELYEEEIGRRVETVWVKGLRAYQMGLDLAGRVQWEGRRVTALEEAAAELQARLEAR